MRIYQAIKPSTYVRICRGIRGQKNPARSQVFSIYFSSVFSQHRTHSCNNPVLEYLTVEMGQKVHHGEPSTMQMRPEIRLVLFCQQMEHWTWRSGGRFNVWEKWVTGARKTP